MWRSVQVLTPPTADPVVLSDVKGDLLIGHDHDDDRLRRLIAAAIARIDGPDGIGYAMMQQDWRLSLDAFGGEIHLPGAPVKSVQSINYFDTAGSAQVVSSALYTVDVDRRPPRIVLGDGATWPETKAVPGAVWIDYRLGEASPANVNADLVLAISMMVARTYEFPAGMMPQHDARLDQVGDILRRHHQVRLA